MTKSRVYKAAGFMPISMIETGGLRKYPIAASLTILKGDAIHDNGAGYATNGIGAFATTFLGIAAEDQDNSGGIAGALDIQVHPLDPHTQFIVPVEANALITQTIVGVKIDLESVNTVDIADTVAAGTPGFFVDEIDASTDAVDGNTYGYAIGHFAVA